MTIQETGDARWSIISLNDIRLQKEAIRKEIDADDEKIQDLMELALHKA